MIFFGKKRDLFFGKMDLFFKKVDLFPKKGGSFHKKVGSFSKNLQKLDPPISEDLIFIKIKSDSFFWEEICQPFYARTLNAKIFDSFFNLQFHTVLVTSSSSYIIILLYIIYQI